MLIVASIFRNSSRYIDAYLAQIAALRDQMPLRLVVCEGDSTDDTYQQLAEKIGPDDTLLKLDHGGPVFGSVDRPERWAQIAMVCNHVLDNVHADPEDKVIYVESDLVWPWDTMVRLAKDLDYVSAVAAMSIHGPTGKFYDVWGHVGLDGVPFTHDPPYHSTLDRLPNPGLAIVPVLSAGSCVAWHGDLTEKIRFGATDCIRGLGASIREQCPLWLDTGAIVWHP